jgi:PAS domain S-box-containing protein
MKATGADSGSGELERLRAELTELRARLARLDESTGTRGRVSLEDAFNIYAQIVSGTSDLMCLVDSRGRYLAANEAYVEAHARSQDEVLGHTMAEVLGDEYFARQVGPHFERCLAGEEAHYENWFDYPRLGRRHVDVKYVPYVRDDGRVVGIIVSIRDTTASKLLEEQLVQSQKMEGIGRLAGGVAHDFNNLLSVILGYAELAQRQLTVEDPLQERLAPIREAAQRAASLTSQLLAFARRQVVEPRVVDLNELLAALHKLLGRLLGADIELATIQSPELWNVRVDPGQFEQVVVNLAVNARDAMPGGGRLQIETSNLTVDEARPGVAPGEWVRMAVTDSGAGIAPEVQEHVFEPFFTTKAVGEGTGLGLATCHGIIEQAGGHLGLTSRPGEGATFEILLPRVDAPTTVEEAAERGDPPTGTETLLVVEDDGLVRRMAAGSLVELGYRVLEAPTGDDALRLAEEHGDKIDLVFTDVVMPGMSGLQLVERLRAVLPELPALFTTGYSEGNLLHGGGSGTEHDVLVKPYTPADLAWRLREVLDR